MKQPHVPATGCRLVVMPVDDIAFEIEHADWPPVDGWPTVIIVLNGADLLCGVGGMGMDPDELVAKLRRPDAERDATVRRCGCGEVGCRSLQVRVTRSDDTVSWHCWTGSLESPDQLPEFCFDSSQYARAINDLSDRVAELPAEP